MISIKYALVIVAAFAAGSFLTPPVQQAIAAVIATDVQCTGCVGAADLASSAVTTTKLASNSVNGGKVTDQSLSAADLGPDSVGASEIKGITKLIFAQCTSPSPTLNMPAGGFSSFSCSISGVDTDDFALAQYNESGNICTDIEQTVTDTNGVTIILHNECEFTYNLTPLQFGAIVWDN